MQTNDLSSFGRWIKERRQALGYTQKEVAWQTGCSIETIRKIEAGQRKPSRQVADLLATCLEVAPEERPAFFSFARQGAEPHAPQQLPPLPRRVAAERQAEADSEAQAPGALAETHSPTNLPASLNAFIGREKEAAGVRSLLWRMDVRLLTLVGPPGIGKTRLSVEVASSLLNDFTDGVFFVPLAPITDPDMVMPAIARALQVRETPDRPLQEAVKSHLQGKRLLLLLDNFEQVVRAAPLVTDLMLAAPRLKVLATSRIPLHVYGEQEFPVPPLSLPAKGQLLPEQLTGYEAIQLFVRRSQAVRPDFSITTGNAEAVADVCRRLDGLPLAIELAAARSKYLQPGILLSQLERTGHLGVLTGGAQDLSARQQTLRAAIEWSYSLLNQDEQRLLRRLAVFAGGFTPEAAEAVCQPTGTEEKTGYAQSALDAIISLADKSLLTQDRLAEGLRFGMLETLREYAFEQLEAGHETEAVQRQHARYYLKLAERAESQLMGGEQEAWLRRLEEEHDNIRVALRWCVERKESEIALRLSGALTRFWYRRGHISEGRGWLDMVLATAERALQPPDDASTQESRSMMEAWAKVLNGAGILASVQGDYNASRPRFEAGLALARKLGDKQSIANTLHNLGTGAQEQGDYASARSMHEESLALRRELGDKRGVGMSLNNLGIILKEQGDHAEARAHQEEGLALRRELGDKWGVAMSLNNLGVIAEEQQDYDAARLYLEQSLALRQDLDDKVGIASCLEELGRVTAASAPGDKETQERAAVLFGAAEALREALNAPLSPVELPLVEQAVADMRASLDEAIWERARAEGRTMTMEEAIGVALAGAPPELQHNEHATKR